MTGIPSGAGIERETEAVEGDLDWCHGTVPRVSRTFAITVSELGSPMTDYICVGYLLCRIADTIEDANHIPADEKSGLLSRYGTSLGTGEESAARTFVQAAESWVPDRPTADWELVRHTPRVLRTFWAFDEDVRTAMQPPILEMIEGMQLFVDRYGAAGGIRIQTLAELEEYSWYVAGTVGTLITELLVPVASERQAEAMRDSAEAFAHLLQLVNIAKDVAEDYREENNVYVPAELLEAQGLEAADLRDPSRAGDLAPVLRELTAHAETYADGAQSWVGAMPTALGATRAAFGVPFLLAIATIRELKRRPEDVFADGGLKVEREEVHELLARFHRGEPSIDGLRRSIADGPLHEA